MISPGLVRNPTPSRRAPSWQRSTVYALCTKGLPLASMPFTVTRSDFSTRGFLRARFRSIDGSDFDDFSGHAVLLAMLAALEIPALFKDLFEGFFAVGQRHPGVAVPLGTREPDCKVPSHRNSPRFFIIPRRNRVAG